MDTTAPPTDTMKNSWFPLAVVVLCQIQVSFNVSIEGIVEDLGIPATSVGLALTTSTFAMAGFVLLGARIGAKIGPRRALHIGKMPDFREPDLTAEDEQGLTLATPRPGR